MKLQPITFSSIPDAIVQRIKEMIAGGLLKPGDRFPNERELGEQIGVGRSSVREAMVALAAMRLVIRNRDGTFVNPDPAKLVWCWLDQGDQLTRSTIREVFETRRLVEVGIVALAAERATPEAVQEIRRWTLADVENVDGFKLADVHFHVAIARATGNAFMCDLYAKVQEILFQTHQYYTELEQLDPSSAGLMYQTILEQHKAILAAIEQRDAVAAQQAMLAHFAALEESMLREGLTEGELDAEDPDAPPNS